MRRGIVDVKKKGEIVAPLLIVSGRLSTHICIHLCHKYMVFRRSAKKEKGVERDPSIHLSIYANKTRRSDFSMFSSSKLGGIGDDGGGPVLEEDHVCRMGGYVC